MGAHPLRCSRLSVLRRKSCCGSCHRAAVSHVPGLRVKPGIVPPEVLPFRNMLAEDEVTYLSEDVNLTCPVE